MIIVGIAFLIHLLLFVLMLIITNFRKNYFHPIYFLIYGNYFYFFILWILWYFIDGGYIIKYQLGYYITLLFGVGFILGIIYFRLVLIKYLIPFYKIANIALPRSVLEDISLKTIFLFFLLLFIIILIFQYTVFNTLNPVEVLIQIELKRQSGIEYEGGISYIKKPVHLLLDVLFCFIVYKSYLHRNYKYIYLSLIMFIYLAIAFGSKSSVLMPLFYLAVIRHIFFKPISLRIIIIFSIFSLVFIAFFQLIRLGFNFTEINYARLIYTLVGRINMELYLTKYFNEGFNINYPNSLEHFFMYFIPRQVLDAFEIEKPIPFGLAFTRYLTHRPDIYMTVAGGGIGEWIHNYSIFNSIYIIYISIIIGGVISAIINLFLAELIKYFAYHKKITKFFIILIFVHIGTFFEFGFSYTVGTFESLFALIFIIHIINFIKILWRFKN